MKINTLHRHLQRRALQSKYIKQDVAISIAQSINYIGEGGVKTSLLEVVNHHVNQMKKAYEKQETNPEAKV